MEASFQRQQEPAGIRQPNLSGAITVALCGLISSVAVAALLSFIELKTGFGLYYLMFWYIVPAGAAISGILAAGGYYFGATIFHHRPGIASFVWVIAISVMTFFLVNILNYSFLQFDGGEYVRDYCSFFEYLHDEITNLEYRESSRGSSTGKLGLFGYGITLLQIIGFSGGGWFICSVLRNKAYCDGCRRYFKNVKRSAFKTKDFEALKLHSDSIRILFADEKFDDAFALHDSFGAKCKFRPEFSAEVKCVKCPTCDEQRISLAVKKRNGNQWEALSELSCDKTKPSPQAVSGMV